MKSHDQSFGNSSNAMQPVQSDQCGDDNPAGMLIRYLDDLFAPETAKVLLLHLAALSPRCGRPTSARTVGSDHLLIELGRSIEGLGDPLAAYVNSVTVAGLLSMADGDALQTLVYHGRRLEGQLEDIVLRLMARQPIRCLDAPENGTRRVREISHQVAMILLGYNTRNDPSLLSRILTIRFKDDPRLVRQQAQRRLIRYTSRGLSQENEWEFRAKALAERLSGIRWDTPVVFESIDEHSRQVAGFGEADRLEQLLSLTTVWVLLHEAPHGSTGNVIVARRQDLEFIAGVLAAAGIDDERHRLSPSAAAMLPAIQRFVSKNAKQRPDTQLEAGGGVDPTRSPEAFSVPSLGEDPVFFALDPSTLHDRLNELERAWMIESCGRHQRRKMWRLTHWGKSYGRKLLGNVLDEFLNPEDRPTSESVADGTPDV